MGLINYPISTAFYPTANILDNSGFMSSNQVQWKNSYAIPSQRLEFKQMIAKDLKTPPVTLVAKWCDRFFKNVFHFFLAPKEDKKIEGKVKEKKEIEFKKRAFYKEDSKDYLNGFYFTNFPPYKFKKDETYRQCQFQAVPVEKHFFILMELTLEETCHIYEMQDNCMKEAFFDIFTEKLNATEIFSNTSNTSKNITYTYVLTSDSNAVPLKWRFFIMSYNKLSDTFLSRIQNKLNMLSGCELTAYHAQTAAFFTPIAILLASAGGFILFTVLGNQKYKLQELEANEVKEVNEESPLLEIVIK